MTTAANVQSLYIAYFNRPADPLGLSYWVDQIDNKHQSLKSVADNFALQTEYTATYGGLSTPQVINAMYVNMFGHGADLPGLQYWVAQVNGGAVTIGQLALSVLGGALGADATAIASKQTAAASFTAAVDTAPEVLAYAGAAANAAAKAWLNPVVDAATETAAEATRDAVISKIVTTPIAGATLTLTTAATDVITGTTGNDIIIGDFGTNTSGGTVQASDTIDGGAGVDTLKLYSFAGNGVAGYNLPVSVKNVEVIDFVAPGNHGDAINTAAYTGVTTVRIEQADAMIAASAITTGNGQGLQIGTAGVGNAAALQWNTSATDTAETLTLSGFKSTGSLTVNGAALKTLNIVSDTGSNTVATLNTGAVTKVVASGDKALTLTGALNANIVTFDASAATGNVKATLVGATAAVTGGAGADTFDVSAVAGKIVASLGAGNDTLKLGATAINTLSTFDGGAGTDTVQITVGGNLTAVNGAQFTGFETLSTGAGSGTYLANAITGITAVNVDGTATAAVIVDKLTTQSVSVTATQTQDVTFKLLDATGKADALTINVGNATTAPITASHIVTSGIETLTFNSTGTSSAANTITSLDVTGATTLVVTGSSGLTVTGFANAATITKIDASASAGFIMGAATGATVGGVYLGGAGADTFIGNAKGDTFYGAGGGDTLTLGAAGAHDTVVYKAGTDSTIALSKVGALVLTGMDVVTNFTSGEDSLDLGTFGFTGTAKSALYNKGAFVSATALLADAAAGGVAGFFNDNVAVRGVAIQTEVVGAVTNVYVFIDANHDGNFTAGTDAVIKLAGVTAGTISLADIGF